MIWAGGHDYLVEIGGASVVPARKGIERPAAGAASRAAQLTGIYNAAGAVKGRTDWRRNHS